MKKYKYTGKTKKVNGTTVHQIVAVRNFGVVKAGDVGGWIKNHKNLSNERDAWVYSDALVYGDAQVYDDALVYGNARVYGNAQVYGNALVSDNAQVFGDARVYGDALVYGNARVYGNVRVYSDAQVSGNVRVSGDAWTKSPLCIQGTKFSVTTSSYTTVTIGCETMTIHNWLGSKGLLLAKDEGFTKAEIQEYREYIKLADKYLKRLRKANNTEGPKECG